MKNELSGMLHQNEAWKEILKQLENENIFFKTKLTDILTMDFPKVQLAHLEFFQSRFLKMDSQIGLLRHEIREYTILLKQLLQTDRPEQEFLNRYRNLGENIFSIRESFHLLRADFQDYLSDAFPGVSAKHIG
ncbi:hypothetical protein [Chitinophaga ginsengisegetis]|uniref:hypothetical protein n=1 Tax=Chitinophaga ginsengisegetis TaxID=393003 RepID=UPI000DB9A9BF|nr:hypothetical protein [Chitinophaga ginsengisegetis]MDR6568237.1 hypothetical protein [Chitinophaga ginsengisegetis]MDR6648532.1 hypothetical protein [Chitinophaga ginsengisegetis]MDR6654318.1 hypothetical protein [Chitinophaga ginsengisegetis]